MRVQKWQKVKAKYILELFMINEGLNCYFAHDYFAASITQTRTRTRCDSALRVSIEYLHVHADIAHCHLILTPRDFSGRIGSWGARITTSSDNYIV